MASSARARWLTDSFRSALTSPKLKDRKIEKGDEVITVSHTAIPTICAICSVGAIPMFVDIDPQTWVMDARNIDSVLSLRTKAIVPVHLYGNMVDVNVLIDLLKRRGRSDVAIIEDVAQAQGAELAGRKAGTLGRFGAFSFYPSKNIGALGDGGAVFCKSSEDMALLKSLRNYGQRDRYHAEIQRGMNSRLDEIQSAILDVKLKCLPRWNKHKTELMVRYRQELSGLPVDFQKITEQCNPAWHLCVLALRDASARSPFATYLQQQGIQTLIHYPIPTHQQPAFSRLNTNKLRITEDLTSRILSIPFNTAMTDPEVEYMTSKIKLFFA